MINDILKKQIEIEIEGFNSQVEGINYKNYEIIQAAICYCLICFTTKLYNLWPWSKECWKPKSPRENLVKAAALIVAEIERIDRTSSNSSSKNSPSKNKKTKIPEFIPECTYQIERLPVNSVIKWKSINYIITKKDSECCLIENDKESILITFVKRNPQVTFISDNQTNDNEAQVNVV